ncbi:MAG: hypothetical protein O7A98_05350 [Acidobacteria bacterium]|nr:hypothetical protein [Acidobacteriota bacterium]
MSLINDALNRARAEAAQRAAAARGEVSLPPTVARTPLLGSSVLSLVAGVALALLILFLWPRGEAISEPETARAGRATPEASISRGEAEPQAELKTELAATGPGGTPNTVGVAQAPAQPAPDGENRTVDAAPAATLIREPEPAPDQIAASTGDPAGKPESAAAAPPPAAIWPANGGVDETWYYVDAYTVPNGGRIELGGIVWSPKAASAMLNGALLTVGNEILGLRVTDIGPRTVILSAGQGRRIALQLGPGGD